jgi:hypothetical protein
VETELEIGQEEPADVDRFRWQVVTKEVLVGPNLFLEAQQAVGSVRQDDISIE